ncbi:MAG: hypothetical protein QOJ09_3020 [Actinomycetota bacterium]|jgi:uncharacterized membrane-anchored protein|nr:hypothetical protein [Actinomycetota bacterium]
MATRKGAEVAIASGPARVDRRTKNLIARLQPGDIAIIDHEDLDRVAAEGLVEARAGAVVNAAPSISGRYPNVGPLLVAAAGIPLVDGIGSEIMDAVHDGQPLRVDGAEIYAGTDLIAKGNRQTLQTLEEQYEGAKATLGIELERFAENTLEFMRRERHVWLDTPDFPDLEVDFRGRHAVVVARGPDYKSDLAHLRSYMREIRPVLVAVDGGADALLDSGFKPDLIVGDMDSVSERALACGAQLVVHAYPGGGAPGAARLEELGLPHLAVEATGTSEDLAMLLAYEKGCELIVVVGSHASMVDFLDKGRPGMASTFLTRLRVGPILVDAKGVNRLYEGRIRKRDMTFLLLSAMACVVVVLFAITPDVLRESVGLIFRDLWRSITH